MFLERGDNVNEFSSNKEKINTPLRTACRSGNRELVSILLENGAVIHPTIYNNVFDHAYKHGHIDIAILLAIHYDIEIALLPDDKYDVIKYIRPQTLLNYTIFKGVKEYYTEVESILLEYLYNDIIGVILKYTYIKGFNK